MDWHVRMEEESKHMASFPHDPFAKSCGNTRDKVVGPKKQFPAVLEFNNRVII